MKTKRHIVNKKLGTLGRVYTRPLGDPEKDCRGDIKRTDSARAATRRLIQRRGDLFDQTLSKLKSAPCSDCGGTFPSPAMQFDHVRGEKLFAIANFKRHPTLAWQRLLDEIAKCDLVCANCHAIRTYERSRGVAPSL